MSPRAHAGFLGFHTLTGNLVIPAFSPVIPLNSLAQEQALHSLTRLGNPRSLVSLRCININADLFQLLRIEQEETDKKEMDNKSG